MPAANHRLPSDPPALLAIDLDGTLLESDLRLTPAVRRALMETRRRGVQVVLATGRMFRSAARLAGELELEGPIVAYNGALIRPYPGGPVLFHQPLDRETAAAVGRLCRERGWFLQAYVDDRLYARERNRKTSIYRSISGVEAEIVGDDVYNLWAEPTKLLIFEPETEIPRIQAEVNDLVGPRVQLATSYPFFLEITARGISKGAALDLLCRRLDLEPSRVMAVGDGRNDLSMIEFAGLGVAVANADPAVKAAALYTCTAAYGEGVVEAVRRYILGGA